MHCFESEDQTYTGTVIFGVESLKSLKGHENLLLKIPLKKCSIFVKVQYSKHQQNGF